MTADPAPTPPAETPADPADERLARAREDVHRSGLAGIPLVLPGDEGRAMDERTAQWNSSLRPFNAFDLWVAERITYHSLRLEDCEHRAIALRALQARRAELCWDADRRRAAEALGARLPRDPARVARLLADTLQGADWLLARWDAMDAVLDAQGDWDASQRTLALDLLGVPTLFRDARTPLDPSPGVDPAAHLRAVVAAEARRLRDHRAAALAELDDRDRSLGRLGKGPESPALAELRREHRFHARQLDAYRALLNGGRRPAGESPPHPFPSCTPIAVPEPEGLRRADPIAPEVVESGPEPGPASAESAADAASAGMAAVPDRPARPGIGRLVPAPAPGNRKSRRAAVSRARRGGL